MKTSILITGGSGFIGRNLVESLGGRYSVLAPTRQEMNLLEPDSVASYLTAHPVDVLIHSATTPGHRNAKPAPVLENNLRMFFNLLSNRRRFGKFINLGSGSEYDMRHYKPRMDESYFGAHIPDDPSGFSKFITSRFLEQDPSAVNLRLFGVYGKYEDYQIRFISNAICKALSGRPITIKQNRRFDYVFVDDLGPILTRFIEAAFPEKSYNVTTDEPIELRTLAEIVRETIGVPSLEIRIAEPGMGTEYTGSNTRLKRDLPGLTFTPPRQAVARLAEWYRSNRQVIREEALLVDK